MSEPGRFSLRNRIDECNDKATFNTLLDEFSNWGPWARPRSRRRAKEAFKRAAARIAELPEGQRVEALVVKPEAKGKKPKKNWRKAQVREASVFTQVVRA